MCLVVREREREREERGEGGGGWWKLRLANRYNHKDKDFKEINGQIKTAISVHFCQWLGTYLCKLAHCFFEDLFI